MAIDDDDDDDGDHQEELKGVVLPHWLMEILRGNFMKPVEKLSDFKVSN